MSEPVLVVLGAGEEQVVLYREARRRGLRTVAVDMRSDRPGIPLADEFLLLSTTDAPAIASALDGRDVAGVVSTAADTCLASWHELSVHFGTPWTYPATAAAVSMDKSAFHDLAASVGVPTYRWAQSDDLVSLTESARGMRFPLVVKPTDASGCRGVLRVDSMSTLDHALANAAASSPRGQVIIEEYLAGEDYTVNVFVRAGELALSVITEKNIAPGPRFLIAGHTAPADLPADVEAALLDDALRLCLAMGLTDGPANFDVIITPDGTRYTLEVGARMSGNGFPQLARAMAGVDCVRALVDLAVGEPFSVRPEHSRVARLHVLTSPLDVPAELVSLGDLAEVAALPVVDAVDVFAAPGDIVQPFTEAGRKLGWVVVSVADRADLPAALETALSAVDIRLEPAAVSV
ncbi:ATP-grasp domain-containing protein [Actinokineospora sp. NBRC 105648]|uniref:ATP-grasp domain-containing protein n=1 Tax=Actinokineospora sp. NBRC 105648 TaxID=3032206 RepID=UPI0024A23D7B|nr:ATP-grasp domain-containing protein [Actinokineospora sp. NBRC 105648]GLZ38879.1 carbamoyl phosphate synthase [Actinokineospora sp. NBRC 105648]